MRGWKAVSVCRVTRISGFIKVSRGEVGEILMAQRQHSPGGIEFPKTGGRWTRDVFMTANSRQLRASALWT